MSDIDYVVPAIIGSNGEHASNLKFGKIIFSRCRIATEGSILHRVSDN